MLKRPKRRDLLFSFRINGEEKQIITNLSEQMGRSEADTVRQIVMKVGRGMGLGEENQVDEEGRSGGNRED